MAGQISTGLTADAEEVVQDPDLVDAEDAQDRDLVLAEVAGVVDPRPSLARAVVLLATTNEAEAGRRVTANEAAAGTTRDRDPDRAAGKAGADQSLGDETRRK